MTPSPPRVAVRSVAVLRLRSARAVAGRDPVVVEEPLEIRLRGRPVAVVMRTPGDEFALAAGFLLTEGIVRDAADVAAIAFFSEAGGADERNVVDVTLARGARFDARHASRAFVATSSCGVCGKASLESVFVRAPRIGSRGTVERSVLASLPARLRSRQALFAATGGLHAAGLFDLGGRLVDVREDVGRHNAVDKVLGAAALARRYPCPASILCVSGRASFEIVQKALVARVPVVASVSAPSSLAVALARRGGLTLVGFLRGRSMNVYAGEARIRTGRRHRK